MEITKYRQRAANATLALTLSSMMITPLVAGCGDNRTSNTGSNAQPPRYGSVPAPRSAPQQNQGMSTGKKVAILAGAAALYYLYNKNKNNKGTGVNGQYYRSKNGRVYYRDAKGNAVYVTPPAGGIQVPAEEAERYNRAVQNGDWDMGGSGNFGTAPSAGGYNDGFGSPSGPGRTPSGVMGGNGNYGGGGGSAVPPGPRGGF